MTLLMPIEWIHWWIHIVQLYVTTIISNAFTQYELFSNYVQTFVGV